MNSRQRQHERTRAAILDAVGAVISEDGLLEFSIQRVADRAGVTHRTVYNHFPTRQALNDAFAAHVEEEMAQRVTPPDADGLGVATLPTLARRFHAIVGGEMAAPLRAYAMLMIGSRAPSDVMRTRSARIERILEDERGPLPPGGARLTTAALRMFLSSVGWHLLTELHGLSNEEAGRVSEWAVRVLLDATAKGDVPGTSDDGGSRDDH